MTNYAIKNKRGDNVVREDEIYDWFSDRENAALCNLSNEPFEFVSKVILNVERHLALASGRAADGRDSSNMRNLKRLGGAGFSLHHILLLAASNFPKELFDHLVRQLESFLFYYIFTKTPTKDLERNFSLWADELRLIADLGDSIAQRNQLNEFVREHFQKNMSAKEHDLSDSLKRYTTKSMQQYRTRYLLSKMSQYVDMAYKGIKIPGSLEEYLTFEIEHILPTNPNEDLMKSFGRESPGHVYHEQTIRLGNLTLLERPINIVASNNFFDLKREEYKKSKLYLTSSLIELNKVGIDTSITRINEKLEVFSKWDAASITKRQNLLVQLAPSIWKTMNLEV